MRRRPDGTRVFAERGETTETLVARNHLALAQARASAEAGLNRAVQATVDYLRGVDPAAIPATLDTLLVTTAAVDAADPFFGVATDVGGADASAEYVVTLMDEDDPDREDFTAAGGEDGVELTDNNNTLVIRALGRARDNTSVILEALIAPLELGAIVVDGDLDISGNVSVTGGVDAPMVLLTAVYVAVYISAFAWIGILCSITARTTSVSNFSTDGNTVGSSPFSVRKDTYASRVTSDGPSPGL